MKKVATILLATASMLFAGQELMAQSDVVTIGNRVYEAKKFRFGAYIAPTFSSMKPTTNKSDDGNYENKNNGSKMGFTYGLMAEYWFSDNYAIASGLQMTAGKGNIISNYVGTSTSNLVRNADITYKLNHIELPLNLKMATDPIENFRFFGQAGFTLGVNVSKKIDYNINYLDADGILLNTKGENEKLNGALGISPVLLSMNIGIGAEYPINNKLSAYAGVFFNNGFLPDVTNPNRYNIKNVPGFKDGNTRLNNFAIRLGLFF